MIPNNELIPVLREAAEGEMIMAGTLLKGVSDEEIAWVVIETVPEGSWHRVTLHAYWHDIFVVSKVVQVSAIVGGGIKWGTTK
jgi:hypothetical protein